MRAAIICGAAILLAAGHVNAEPLVVTTTSPDGASILDLGTLRKVGSRTRAWTFDIMPEGKSKPLGQSGMRFDEARQFMEFDCAEGLYRVLQGTIYLKGDHLHTTELNLNEAWSAVPPDTVVSKYSEAVCSGATELKRFNSVAEAREAYADALKARALEGSN